jgi:hypothetical protein
LICPLPPTQLPLCRQRFEVRSSGCSKGPSQIRLAMNREALAHHDFSNTAPSGLSQTALRAHVSSVLFLEAHTIANDAHTTLTACRTASSRRVLDSFACLEFQIGSSAPSKRALRCSTPLSTAKNIENTHSARVATEIYALESYQIYLNPCE